MSLFARILSFFSKKNNDLQLEDGTDLLMQDSATPFVLER